MKPVSVNSTRLIRAAVWSGMLVWAVLAGRIDGCDAMATVTDRAIREAVEHQMSRFPEIDARRIDVAVADGIVTLSGHVDNLLSKKRAGRISAVVKGVRAVVNTISVRPPVLRSDRDIMGDVREALANDPSTDAHDIRISVKDNVVTLTGTVDAWQDKELCAAVAMGVKGVRAIDNDIVFVTRDSRPDTDIQHDILQALRWDVMVGHRPIDVDVSNGNVVLSGTVGSLAEKMRAMARAYVANVKTVDTTRLEVREWAKDPQLKGDAYQADLTDSAIEIAVKDALTHDPRVNAAEINPQVLGGEVILRGSVDNLSAKRAAARTAGTTVGIRRVVNRLEVKPADPHDDGVIKTRIERALKRDPFVDRADITVTVRNGRVDLFGSVPTFFDKRQAEDIVTRVYGVITVHNNIVVASPYDPQPFDPLIDQ